MRKVTVRIETRGGLNKTCESRDRVQGADWCRCLSW